MNKDLPPSCPITPIPETIGPYRVIRKIASGGMGEVFAVYDSLCKRTIALKKIRGDLFNKPNLQARFLKEAHIAAKLSHPSIIPVYSLYQNKEEIYYTMPLVEGKTLKEILRETLAQEKKGIFHHTVGSSIPSLMRMFLSICQAVAYSHSKGILHRDLKPENIMIGTYGEVFILDWGLANHLSMDQEEELCEQEPSPIFANLTSPGKIAGTLSYLPPERILGKRSSYSCDIYALGVILYQLLTLRVPFHRKSIKECRKHLRHEVLIEPIEKAPYRDIPDGLSKIAKKCLARHIDKRYERVEDLLLDLNNYIEGKAEWTPRFSIQIDHKADWEFQENILLPKQMEWIQLMVSNHSFLGNMKLETHARLKEGGQGIGFLLNIKPEEERKDLFHESFFFWVGSKQKPGCSLFHSNISLLENPNIFLTPSFSHCIRIEKTENHLKLYLDNVLALDYLSHIPFHGPLFGIILKDAEIEIGTILLSSSSPNILINCLSVADTLLSLRYFKPALSEYKQIAKSFAGRAEGREATFRAGITLLEEAKKKSGKEKEQLQQQALEEFGYLHNTPGAPLEYLGKSLIYKATQDILEEIKCLELSLRKFPKHPLTQWIKDQLVFRLHEAFYKDRKSTYHFTLLCIKQIPEIFEKKDHQNLLKQLQRSFVSPDFLSPPCRFQSLALQLAFWLDKPSDLLEIIDSSLSLEKEAIASLLYLGYMDLVRQLSPKIFPLSFLSGTQALDLFFLDQFYLVGDKERQSRLKLLLAHPTLDPLVLQRNIEFLIFFQRKQEARALLSQMAPISSLSDASPFYFLWGCLLALEEGEKAALSFLSHQMNGFFLGKPGRSSKWFQEAFFFEKALFFKQQMLFYRACHQEKKFLVAEKRLYQLYREKSMK